MKAIETQIGVFECATVAHSVRFRPYFCPSREMSGTKQKLGKQKAEIWKAKAESGKAGNNWKTKDFIRELRELTG
jgi:hypothetical protein